MVIICDIGSVPVSQYENSVAIFAWNGVIYRSRALSTICNLAMCMDLKPCQSLTVEKKTNYKFPSFFANMNYTTFCF